MSKCKKCVCTQCEKEFGIAPMECKFSDCNWCRAEERDYEYTTCNKYWSLRRGLGD